MEACLGSVLSKFNYMKQGRRKEEGGKERREEGKKGRRKEGLRKAQCNVAECSSKCL